MHRGIAGLLLTAQPAGHLGSCAGRALVARARQGGELARWRVLRQRRPPAAPSLLATRDMSRDVPEAGPEESTGSSPSPSRTPFHVATLYCFNSY